MAITKTIEVVEMRHTMPTLVPLVEPELLWVTYKTTITDSDDASLNMTKDAYKRFKSDADVSEEPQQVQDMFHHIFGE